jgi:purine-nucleoside phosphorylase
MRRIMRTALFSALLAVLSCTITTAQTAQMANINTALRTGNVGGIAQYIDNVIDITINNNQSTYSKAQAEMVLRDFFAKHSPKDFVSEKTGNGNNTFYTIGHLTVSGTCSYRIYISMRMKEGAYFLQELRFEK